MHKKIKAQMNKMEEQRKEIKAKALLLLNTNDKINSQQTKMKNENTKQKQQK